MIPSAAPAVVLIICCLLAVLAVALTTVVLAKPIWFWQFPDVWTGNDEHLAPAELEFVETLHLRPIIVLFVGSMTLIFAHFAMIAFRNPAPCETWPLSRWLKVVTAAATLFPAVVAGLIASHPDLFFASGQAWLAWIVTGGLGLLGLGGSIGWLNEKSLFRPILAWAGLGAAGWAFAETPTNEFAIPLDLRIQIAYVLPGSLLCLCHMAVFVLARWPHSSPELFSRRAEPRERSEYVLRPLTRFGSPRRLLALLLRALVVLLFVRTNYLLPHAGMVRAVLCFDAGSGELLWKTPVYVDVTEKKHPFNSHATPTPACDEDGVYVYFGGGLSGLDKSGRLRWLVRDPDFHRFSRYGTGFSLVLSGDTLIVYNDSEFRGHGDHLDDNIESQQGRRPSALSAFDKKTGRRRWSVAPEFSHDSYMTPLVWQQDGDTEVVIATWKTLAAFALKDGALKWTRSHPMEQIVPSLAVNGDCLFVMGGNFQPYPIYAIRPTEPEPVWSVANGGANIVSPVCWEGKLYTVNHAGILLCRDADSGRLRWRARLGGRCLASLSAGDGKLYVVDQEGTLYVVDAKSSDVMAEFVLEENCAATPALAGGCIFVRTEKHLCCLGRE